MAQIKLTVFTPIYNRANKITNLFNSLKKQDSFEFEWIIIDDGSTDNLDDIVDKFLNEKVNFPIIYVKQKNQGKQNSWNKAAKIARGKYFMCIDSDDYLLDNKTKLFIESMDSIVREDRIIGCSFLNIIKNNSRNCGDYHGDTIDLPYYKRKKYNLLNDQTEIFKTYIFRKIKFPEISGETFIPEGFLFNKITLNDYIFRYIKKTVSVKEYYDDGLTNNLNKIINANPRSFLLYLKSNIDVAKYFKLRGKKYANICNSINHFKNKYSLKYLFNYFDLNFLERTISIILYYPYLLFKFAR